MIRWLILLACVSTQSFADDGKRLYVDMAGASSYLSSVWNKYDENYHPNYAVDDDPKTAWVEGVEGQGEGQTLEMQVSKLGTADKLTLKIRNGYQKSRKLLEANSAPKDIIIHIAGSNGRRVISTPFTLKREMGWQTLEIPLNSRDGLSRVDLEIKSVYPGSVYKDTCVSDVQIFVQSKVPYDEKAEKAKFAELQSWRKKRLADAKYFASLPSTYPFAGTRFKRVQEQEDSCPHQNKPDEKCFATPDEDLAQWIRQPGKIRSFVSKAASDLVSIEDRVKKLAATGKYWQVVPSAVAKQRVAPDGLPRGILNSFERYINLNELSLLETTKSLAHYTKGDNSYVNADSNAMIERDSEGRPRLIYSWELQTGYERGPYTAITNIVRIYDEKGRLTETISWTPNQRPDTLFQPAQKKNEHMTVPLAIGGSVHRTRFSYDSSAKIEGAEYAYLQTFKEYEDGWNQGLRNFEAEKSTLSKN